MYAPCVRVRVCVRARTHTQPFALSMPSRSFSVSLFLAFPLARVRQLCLSLSTVNIYVFV